MIFMKQSLFLFSIFSFALYGSENGKRSRAVVQQEQPVSSKKLRVMPQERLSQSDSEVACVGDDDPLVPAKEGFAPVPAKGEERQAVAIYWYQPGNIFDMIPHSPPARRSTAFSRAALARESQQELHSEVDGPRGSDENNQALEPVDRFSDWDPKVEKADARLYSRMLMGEQYCGLGAMIRSRNLRRVTEE
jgi:hypothetical protein